MGPLFLGFGIGVIAGVGLAFPLIYAFILGAFFILLGTIITYGSD